MHACMHTHVHAYMYTYIHIHAYLHTTEEDETAVYEEVELGEMDYDEVMYACVHVCMYVFMYSYMYVFMFVKRKNWAKWIMTR